MELILRGSEYQSFLDCRKNWLYSWVERIKPKRPNNKLFTGVIFHKWLENYYNANCEKLAADFETSVWMNEQDTSGMEQTELDEIKTLIKGMAAHYDNTYRESDSKWKVLATELEFIVKLEDDIFYTGTIDLVYEVDGKIRFADHKTVSSISMYEDKAQMDRQISRYWWVMEAFSRGIARAKNVDGLWVPFPELEGKEIDGFDYNLIKKSYPTPPEQLKKGGLSKAKNQNTSHELYLEKLYEMGLDVDDYAEILNILKEKGNPWSKRVNVQRNAKELEAAMWEFMYTAGDLHDVKMMITQSDASELAIEQMTYRNIGHKCENMCEFKAICQAEISGGNVSLVKNLAYIKNEERVK